MLASSAPHITHDRLMKLEIQNAFILTLPRWNDIKYLTAITKKYATVWNTNNNLFPKKLKKNKDSFFTSYDRLQEPTTQKPEGRIYYA